MQVVSVGPMPSFASTMIREFEHENFNVRSKAGRSQLYLSHGTRNKEERIFIMFIYHTRIEHKIQKLNSVKSVIKCKIKV